ncbi:polycystic kidney disease 1-like 2 [Labeo rohita]|uniref:Polycystic kidney disease 1-like 2 n=1 Tax=Labeo rohita TaxID=84645 RepID=A0A498M8D8_LABRO|nr:polycystic kidney disease 1-like 2 [Labeo rohita]RXN31636.1 polycystic kidney disease 1-like 2 [Labeo rohita]
MGYKKEKDRLVMEMGESTDKSVRDANVQIHTGCKWKAHVEVDQTISRLQQKVTIGRVQVGRAGLGHGEAPKFWSKASRKERKELVVAEVTSIENEQQKVKAIAQGHQGNWTMWESVVSRNISLAQFLD